MLFEFLNKETAVRNVTGVTVHGSVARLPGVRTRPASGPSRPPQGRTVEPFIGVEIHMEMDMDWKWMEMGHFVKMLWIGLDLG